MPTLRHWVLALSVTGLFAGLPLGARACDNDRFPCPIVVEVPEPSASPRPKPRRKASQAARADERPRARVERSAPGAVAKGRRPSEHEEAAAPVGPPSAEADPEMGASSLTDRFAGEDNESAKKVATAAVHWPAAAATDDAGASPPADAGIAAPDGEANAVALVDASQINEIDLTVLEQESSWSFSLLLILGAALGAASTLWLLPRLVRKVHREGASTRTGSEHAGAEVATIILGESEDEASRRAALRAPALMRAGRRGAVYTRGRMAA